MTSAFPNLASMCDGGSVELVWENGQILKRGVSNRTEKRIPSSICLSASHTSNPLEKIGGDSFNTKKTARFESLESILGSDSTLLGPAGLKKNELSKHDHKIDPYLNYPHAADSLQDAHHTELLPAESYEPHLMNTSNCHDKHLMDSNTVPLHENLVNLKQARTCQLYKSSSLRQNQASQNLDFICSNYNSSRMQDLGTSKKMGSANFSHFLRTVAFVKAGIQGFGTPTRTSPSTPGLSGVDSLKNTHKNNPVESIPTESAEGSKIVAGFQNQAGPMATKVVLVSPDVKPRTKDPFPDEHSEAVCQEDTTRKYGSRDQVLCKASSFAASAAKEKIDYTEKSIKPQVASSSLCSHGASNDPTYYLKRKYHDTEESAYPSVSVEEDSEDETKAAPARCRGRSGSKRCRTAEVHNLSERKRRDKINKKICALQDLIPNCNKVDKASMLDEAIEYLKTLQLQVQIMSMGTGLFMPPMMLPTGMQQIHPPHFTHFSPMGFGMGMRMGTGIGCSPPQFPSSPTSGTRLQMLGLSSQVLPMSVSCAPFTPLPGRGSPSTQSIPVHDVSAGAPSIVMHPTSAPTSGSKDSVQNIN